MKKLFLLFTMALIVASCTPEEKTQPQINAEQVEGAHFTRVIEYGYKGHDYIMFIQGTSDFRVAGIVHNPECHCFDDAKDLVEKMQNEYYD